MKCLHCNNELKQVKGKKERKFCNDTCRMAYGRGKSEQVKSEQVKSEHSKANKSEQNVRIKSEQIKSEQIKSEQPKANKSNKLEKLKEEYEEALDFGRTSLDNDNSKVKDFLERTPLKDLQEAGIFVPNWKKHGDKYPICS